MRKNLSFFIFFLSTMALTAQSQQMYTSAELYKKIEKLNFLGSVLYVGAHPDDENTSMISYLSNKTNARVGYLSMNRGDGGQNIMGTEMRELLGVIRTEELLAARKIDGGEQFFTRANDFGFSKNPTETFEFWDKDKVLHDVVLTFRKFRPDVVINRFNHRTEGDTHGHHTASAILSVEAFSAAADPQEFSNQLDRYKTWQLKRMYFNDSWFFYGDKEKFHQADHRDFLTLELGAYLPILGLSNLEIAALSRSEHKSQGFGSLGERGSEKTYIEPIKGDTTDAKKDLFAGIDTSWNRIEGGKEIGEILYAMQEDFDFKAPQKSIQALLKARKLIVQLEDAYWRELKTEQIEEIIGAVAGLYLEAYVEEPFATLGEEISLNLEAINRSDIPIKLNRISIKGAEEMDVSLDKPLDHNQGFEEEIKLKIPSNTGYTNPYWLTQPYSLGMYTVENPDLIGLPNTPPALSAVFELEILGKPIRFDREIIYKAQDQILGEVKEPFSIVPDVSVVMNEKVLVFPDNDSRTVAVEIQAYADAVKGKLQLDHPKGWKVNPKEKTVKLDNKGEKKTVEFELTPPKNQSEGKIQPKMVTEKQEYDKELILIDYSHIPTKTVLLPAQTKVNRIDISISGKKIGYVHGAGDEIPSGLREIGYQVDEIDPSNVSLSELSAYDAIVLGIRAYNVNNELVTHQNLFFDYVKAGGTLVTQYSQSRSLLTDKLSPYPMNITPKRVTDETAEVSFLDKTHPVLHTPNKITETDFDGWVQERGLYYPDEWSDEFTPILGMHDKGEDELDGALLIAPYGEGHYVYTGLSFFRQLPAGVPGAYRLFANILAL